MAADFPRPGLDVETLFRAHAAFVASFVHRLGVADSDVDDVVQNVFLIAHRKGDFVPGRASPRSWLAAIASRVAADARRTRRRRREDYGDAVLARAAEQGLGPDRAAEVAASMRRLQEALDGLDVDRRAVFVLYEIEGESCGDIAAALGVPVGTVYSRLHHARAHVRRAYSAESRFPQAPARLGAEGDA